MDVLKLGIICREDGKIINHRSFIKVVLNPVLRLIGIEIATKYDPNTNEILSPIIHFIKPTISNIKFKMECGMFIKKERRFI